MAYEFKMPEVGEGVTEGVVGKLLVKEGDRVSDGQLVVEIETDKALVEVPVDRAGVVEKFSVKSGDKIPIGGVLLTIAEETAAGGKSADAPAAAEPQPKAAQAEEAKPAAEPQPNAAQEKPAASNGSSGKGSSAPALSQMKSRVELAPATNGGSELIAAGPASRRLARELKVDLAQVAGSGPRGRITKEDVMAYAGGEPSAVRTAPGGELSVFEPALPDFARWGDVERETINVVRRKTAEHMSLSWRVIPHVTQFEDVDITELEEFRQRHKDAAADRGAKLTLTALAIKAAISALRRYPQFNASFDSAAGEIVYKKYINIGIATETERGLLVPVIHNAHSMELFDLAAALGDLAGRAREGKLALEEMQGGSFTISNQGGIGGGHFTPIVNYPEVAIMAIGRSRIEPRYIDGEIAPRTICPLGVSYDHRVIDGAMAARFIDALKGSLEDPEKLLLGL